MYEVSDPFHSRYGQHLSRVEVEALVAPHPESLELVNEWLASHGFEEDDIIRSPAKDWATVVVPVRLAEEMLDTVRTMIVQSKTYDKYTCRPITFGRMGQVASQLFEPRATAYPFIFMNISKWFNPQQHFHASRI